MLEETVKKRIEDLLKNHEIILFMKGDKYLPKCGFSAKVVEILSSYEKPYTSFDILEDEAIRQGLKIFSDWPTYPQLYVRGQLIGGADIIEEMHEAGELSELFKDEKA